jgi:hypothetical protein
MYVYISVSYVLNIWREVIFSSSFRQKHAITSISITFLLSKSMLLGSKMHAVNIWVLYIQLFYSLKFKERSSCLPTAGLSDSCWKLDGLLCGFLIMLISLRQLAASPPTRRQLAASPPTRRQLVCGFIPCFPL